MPNRTYELRNLYLQQSHYCAEETGPYQRPVIQWPATGYWKRFEPDAHLLQQVLSDSYEQTGCIADQIFGSHKRRQYTDVKHLANLLSERAKLHAQHIRDIDDRHREIQEKKFGVEINHTPDKAKRLTNLESQLLQLEAQRRDEELAFWKDSVELRQKMFEAAGEYRAASHRYSVFSAVEGRHGR